jgi:glycerol-3-phosphate responsive antiterminator
VRCLILEKVAINVKYFVIKVAKCKLSSIMTSIQNTTKYLFTITVLIAKKQQTGNYAMSYILDTIKVNRN